MKKFILWLMVLTSINAFSSELKPCKIEGIYYNETESGVVYIGYGKPAFFNFNSFEKCYKKAKEIANKSKSYIRDSSFGIKIGDDAEYFLPYSKKLPIFFRYSMESPEGSDLYFGKYETGGAVTKFTNTYDNGVFIKGNAKFTESGELIELNK